jgi:hypothetical protein
MSQISSVGPGASQAPAAAQASQANAEAGNVTPDQSNGTKLGLPPVGLAQAASANTLNAALVSSEWGIDPASVSGLYGGAGAAAGLFASDNLLPLLRSISPANAEQALALIGIQTPTPGKASGTSQASPGSPSAAAAAQASQALLDQASTGSAPMVVDPLWGRSA